MRIIKPSLRLALIYLGFSVLWILSSDAIVAKIANNDIYVIGQLQTIKGIIFVLSSSILLFFSSFQIYRSLNKTLLNKEELLDKLNALKKASREGIIEYDIETDSALVNDEIKALFEVDTSIISNFSVVHNHHIHRDDKQRVQEYFRSFIVGNNSVWQCEYRYAFSKGYKDIISRGYVIKDKKTKKPVKVLYAIQDVSELRDTRMKYHQQQMVFRHSISRTMIEAEEKERDRWAQELHDNVCQVLTVAKLFTEEALRTHDDPFVKRSQTMIEKAINDIRHISASIKPPEFSTTSLHEALEGLLGNIKRFVSFDFKIKYDSVADQLLSEEQKLMVYRVVQEQLNNITKYASATKVDLSISVVEGQVTVIIKDDGNGFDPANVKTGIGLKNISSRLQLFSGDFIVNSSPGKGCELIASFSIA